MEKMVFVVDLLFFVFVLGAVTRVVKYFSLVKKHGIKHVHVSLSTNESKKDGTNIYESAETIMTMIQSVITIFLWLYVNYWM